MNRTEQLKHKCDLIFVLLNVLTTIIRLGLLLETYTTLFKEITKIRKDLKNCDNKIQYIKK